AIGPSTGSLTVMSHTTGTDLDPDGYTVTVEGVSRALPLDGSTTYTGLSAGAVTVSLSGVAANCSIFGTNPRSVNVVAGSTVSTTFDVGCSTVTPPPTATQLRFQSQPPSVAVVGGTFAVSVAALDGNGNLVPTYTGRVNLVLSGGLLGVSLAGTTGVDAVNGIATFTDLHVTGPCVGCRIQAGAAGLVTATSDAFTIVVP
ncbi:MAG TPA: hypothetical protein VL295_05875, partial [Gemmatimonadales bacterium]|nr:hypothetical protein [Gemmatimonadales bacterium]